jgi:hypothetical protein
MCTLPEISLLEACVMWVSWQRREILCMVILLDLDWRVTTYWPLRPEDNDHAASAA